MKPANSIAAFIFFFCLVAFCYASPQMQRMDFSSNPISLEAGSPGFSERGCPRVMKAEAAAEPVGKPTLAVLYFDNKTGDKKLEYLRSGLADWILTDLSQSRYINVLDLDRIHGFLDRLRLLDAKPRPSSDFNNIAELSKASHILQGRIIKDDDGILISTELWSSASGKIIRSFRKECADEDGLPSLVDDLTREIKAELDLTPEQINDDFDKEVGRITTTLPEAYRYYMKGQEHRLRRQNQEAVSSYGKALEIDPEFAVAYWKMGMSFPRNTLSSYSKKAAALQKALALPDRLAKRAFYWIQGDYHSMTRYRYDKAIEAFGKLFELYPDDHRGRLGMALVYFDLEEWEKAAVQFKSFIEAGHESPGMFRSLARSYMNPGSYDEAQSVLEDYLEGVGDDLNIYLTLALNFRYQGKYDAAHRVVDKAISLYPGSASCYANKGDIYLYSGEPDMAERVYRSLLNRKSSEFQDLGVYRLSELYLLQGRLADARALAGQGFARAETGGQKGLIRDRLSFSAWVDFLAGHSREALAKLDALWKTTLEDEELEWQRFVVYIKGLVYADTGDIDRALAESEKLKELIGRGLDKKKMRLHLHLMGVIDLKRGKYSEAVENLEKSLPMICIRSRLNIAVADTLATAYFEIGDLDKARKEYDRMASFPRGRQFYGDVYAKISYRLGGIFEKQGLIGKAVESYEKFLRLWKDADSGLPEVAHAKMRLAAIRTSKKSTRLILSHEYISQEVL